MQDIQYLKSLVICSCIVFWAAIAQLVKYFFFFDNTQLVKYYSSFPWVFYINISSSCRPATNWIQAVCFPVLSLGWPIDWRTFLLWKWRHASMAEPAVLVNSTTITHFRDFLILAMNFNVCRLLSNRCILLKYITRPPSISS